MMADDISKTRDTETVVQLADAPFSLSRNEQATKETDDFARNEINYLTGLRLKIVAVTYV